ncbi:MAG: response regulator transcription factor [bacterium]
MSEKPSVLIVDDEAHIRKLLYFILKKMGFVNIYQAKNGDEGISLLVEYHPQIILLDINMPIMNGLQALEEIIAISPEAKVIMLTSLANREVVEKCAALGASDFIRKDTPQEEIVQSIKELLE